MSRVINNDLLRVFSIEVGSLDLTTMNVHAHDIVFGNNPTYNLVHVCLPCIGWVLEKSRKFIEKFELFFNKL